MIYLSLSCCATWPTSLNARSGAVLTVTSLNGPFLLMDILTLRSIKSQQEVTYQNDLNFHFAIALLFRGFPSKIFHAENEADSFAPNDSHELCSWMLGNSSGQGSPLQQVSHFRVGRK